MASIRTDSIRVLHGKGLRRQDGRRDGAIVKIVVPTILRGGVTLLPMGVLSRDGCAGYLTPAIMRLRPTTTCMQLVEKCYQQQQDGQNYNKALRILGNYI